MCLHYAFSKVLKSPTLVHNFEPFRHWSIETINNPYYLRTQNRNGEESEKEETENMTHHFVVADATVYDKICFAEDWTHSDWGIVVAEMVSIVQTCCSDSYLNPMREFSWIRLYHPNNSLFVCDANDFAFYAKAQTLKQEPVKVFKEIMRRQITGSFQQREVLKIIASPYYYIFPHQDEKEYSDFEINTAFSFDQQTSHKFFTRVYIAVAINERGISL
ncbi:uncharacterized protein TNCV_3095611 [Trichonephila clavipes]|nr:uncharacterized protein TNCV_3095611 [Trichonephila clavipes]